MPAPTPGRFESTAGHASMAPAFCFNAFSSREPGSPSLENALQSRQGKPTMTVRAGREFLAIPGPTTMPDEVLQAMHRPALDIYSKEMVDLTESLLADLSKLFVTKGQSYIHIANGHGAWEGA